MRCAVLSDEPTPHLAPEASTRRACPAFPPPSIKCLLQQCVLCAFGERLPFWSLLQDSCPYIVSHLGNQRLWMTSSDFIPISCCVSRAKYAIICAYTKGDTSRLLLLVHSRRPGAAEEWRVCAVPGLFSIVRHPAMPSLVASFGILRPLCPVRIPPIMLHSRKHQEKVS